MAKKQPFSDGYKLENDIITKCMQILDQDDIVLYPEYENGFVREIEVTKLNKTGKKHELIFKIHGPTYEFLEIKKSGLFLLFSRYDMPKDICDFFGKLWEKCKTKSEQQKTLRESLEKNKHLDSLVKTQNFLKGFIAKKKTKTK